MPLDRETLERMSRGELIAAARELGVRHPELMTRVELTDEILRLTERAHPDAPSARGWLGVARDLIASLVERGLNLPQAAALIRGGPTTFVSGRPQTPVATVTLAEIYAAQGHVARALRILDDVLSREPDHAPARDLRDRLASEQSQRMAKPPRRGLAQRDVTTEAPGEPALVTISADDDSRQIYWELDLRTTERLARHYPGGAAVVRVVSFQPSWDGARRTEQDLPAEPGAGHVSVEPANPGAVLRAVLGWKAGEEFRPLALDLALDVDGERVDSWLPPRQQDAERDALGERALAACRSA